MNNSYTEYSLLFKVFSDETRLKILDMLSCGEMCACDILAQLEISQSTLSHHMKTLTESGLVHGRKDGAWMKYTIVQEKADGVVEFMKYLLNEKEECSCYQVKETCKK